MAAALPIEASQAFILAVLIRVKHVPGIRTTLTQELGDASYLIGDDTARLAAVVDPQVDVEQYVELARKHGLSIRYVVQTHIHEDFLSGALALAEAAGGAELCVSGHDAPRYGYPHRLVHDGEVIELGSVLLAVKHTPGHTPEQCVGYTSTPSSNPR